MLALTKCKIVVALSLVAPTAAVAAPPKSKSDNRVSQIYDARGQCSLELANSTLLTHPFVIPDQGHEIAIHNGSRAHAFVKITTPDGYRELRYVERGGTSKSLALSDGVYRIQFALGGRLAADCETVIDPESLGEFPQQSLVSRETSDAIEFSVVSFTLFTVRNGNVRSRKITVADFNKD